MYGWNPLDRVFYYPTTKTYDDPGEYGLSPENVWFSTRDGVRLHGWLFRATSPAAGTILHFHGNAGNVSAHFPLIAWLPEAGWNVLCFDYRGYGRSEGRTTRSGTILDGQAAVDYLVRRGDVDIEKLVAFGQSIGGAVATVIGAARPEIKAFILDGTFTGYRRIARYHVLRNPVWLLLGWWAPRLLISEGYDAVDFIGCLQPRPVLILHGKSDHIVPWRMAVDLYHAAAEPKELVLLSGTGHLETTEAGSEAARDKLLSFLARLTKPAATPATGRDVVAQGHAAG